jgi:hypothetical protein
MSFLPAAAIFWSAKANPYLEELMCGNIFMHKGKIYSECILFILYLTPQWHGTCRPYLHFEDYLKLHQRTLDSYKKKIQTLFTKYLVVHCWEKMFQWINDWSLQACIYILGNINLKWLKHAVASIMLWICRIFVCTSILIDL